MKRLEILRSKFFRLKKSVEKPNWEFTGKSIIIYRNEGNIEIFEDRFEFNNKVIPLSNIKTVFWMGRNRPIIGDTALEDGHKYKMNNYDRLGFELEDSTYFEIDNLSNAYADFLKYIEWVKKYGNL